MNAVELRSVSKSFGDALIIPCLDLSIPQGAFTVLVGPSGCGKSTTLRMMAGLDTPTSGTVLIDGVDVTNADPADHDVAMVFQNYALYPTMSVKDNIDFGLRNRKVPKAEREELIAQVSETVGLTDQLKKKPSQLSGGQRQRVALARAMVKKPSVFLMDEPLSNLDAQLRAQMRGELISLHKLLGTTFVYVTHDQVEAMSMGTHIVLLNKGEIVQQGPPMELYSTPANRFSAQFIGTPPMNIVAVNDTSLEGAVGLPAGVEFVGARPEAFRPVLAGEHPPADNIVVRGTVVSQELLGAEALYLLDTSGHKVQLRVFGMMPFEVGDQATIACSRRDLHYFDAAGERIVHV